MTRVKMTEHFDDPGCRHWYWGTADGRPGSLVTYLERPAQERPAAMGTGAGHHSALAVAAEEAQLALRERLLETGAHVSPVMDRVYFKRAYTRDPDGHIVELATMGPGFLVDEPMPTMGTTLCLPPWLEVHRDEIAPHLSELDRAPWPYDGGEGAPDMCRHPGRRLDLIPQVETVS